MRILTFICICRALSLSFTSKVGSKANTFAIVGLLVVVVVIYTACQRKSSARNLSYIARSCNLTYVDIHSNNTLVSTTISFRVGYTAHVVCTRNVTIVYTYRNGRVRASVSTRVTRRTSNTTYVCSTTDIAIVHTAIYEHLSVRLTYYTTSVHTCSSYRTIVDTS